jgi:hypothetical protein
MDFHAAVAFCILFKGSLAIYQNGILAANKNGFHYQSTVRETA